MSDYIRAKDLRIKLFRGNTNKDMESTINTWLSNCEEEFEVVDISLEHYFSPVMDKVMCTGMIVFRII